MWSKKNAGQEITSEKHLRLRLKKIKRSSCLTTTRLYVFLSVCILKHPLDLPWRDFQTALGTGHSEPRSSRLLPAPLSYLEPISIIATTIHPNLTNFRVTAIPFSLIPTPTTNQSRQILFWDYFLHSLPLFHPMLQLRKSLKVVSNSGYTPSPEGDGVQTPQSGTWSSY